MCFYKVVVFGAVMCGVSGLVSDINDNKCGVEASSNLIHHDPWAVFMEFYRHEHMLEVRCGGTLIGPRHVLTAAHCIKKIRHSSLKVRLGEYDLSSEVDCVRGVCADPVVRIEVDEVFVHPDYDGKEHDIAVLRLKQNAPYTDFIRPICLPSGHLEENVVFSAAGFGEIPTLGVFSNIKKIVPLPNWNVGDCKAAYPNSVLPQNIICAGGEDGIDTCRGDSGGPLTWYKDRAELWGVTSNGDVNCGTKGSPGIYTSVLHYLDWIKSIVEA